ncbi:MAG: aspartate/glutamate racemase family protein [Candidatus Aminicenantes bacterium]|nr:aspartate/glutamate racemase family protein [Candidatus Aminicenantes bacterium]
MKTIGLLGGMTSESSLVYYKLVNEMAREKLGGSHSAKSVMVSVDFGEIEPHMERGEWERVLAFMIGASRAVEKGGADFLVLCTNTMHKFVDEISRGISIPILHIVDATAAGIRKAGMKKVGLLGTRFTMEEDFYKGRLLEKHGITALVPEKPAREQVHKVIMDELSRGIINPASRDAYWRIINDLAVRGAEGIILGCTEIPLLVKPKRGAIPLFDTTAIHAGAAVDLALDITEGVGGK